MSNQAAETIKNAKRIVIKVGSALLIDENGNLHAGWLYNLVKDIASLRKSGKDVIIVSSGAVALGRRRLGIGAVMNKYEKHAAAAAGQVHIINAYENAFAGYQTIISQVLLTLDVTDDRVSYLNARDTLDTLLDLGSVPVVNENDSVTTREGRYGDNDRLAAYVSQMTDSDALILLSDIDGLYTADPRMDQNAEFIPVVTEISEEIRAMAGGTARKGAGTGGMRTKILAAEIAMQAGVSTIIAKGRTKEDIGPITRLLGGGQATLFKAEATDESARRIWIGSHFQSKGTIYIDEGAEKAIRDGANLLAAGISRVDGQFEKGDAVSIANLGGEEIAKGLTGYSASEIQLLAGAKTADIAERVGYKGRAAVVHYQDLVFDD